MIVSKKINPFNNIKKRACRVSFKCCLCRNLISTPKSIKTLNPNDETISIEVKKKPINKPKAPNNSKQTTSLLSLSIFNSLNSVLNLGAIKYANEYPIKERLDSIMLMM